MLDGIINGIIAFLGWRQSKWGAKWLIGYVMLLVPVSASHDANITKKTIDMIVYLWYRCTSIKHPVQECKIIVFERYLSLSLSPVLSLFKYVQIIPLYKFGVNWFQMVFPSQVIFPYPWTLWLYWAWSIQWTVFCLWCSQPIVYWLYQGRECHGLVRFV